MTKLNYKHLRYFWMVAKTGSIAKASAQLHLTPQSISGQISEFEQALECKLLRRVGRNVELTEAGLSIVAYADEIFSLGDELLSALHQKNNKKVLTFRVGIADCVPKTVAYRLLEPAIRLDESVRLVCREGRLSSMLAELSINRLDMVIADRAMPGNFKVRGFSNLLAESSLTVFGEAVLVKSLRGKFPENLSNAPFLLPGEDFAIRPKLSQWIESYAPHLQIRGEFDDSALMKSFGQAGVGLFTAPTAQAKDICTQYKVKAIGEIEKVRLQIYAITTERRITHPAIIAIRDVARHKVFKEVNARVRKA
jgi:LysR family transcriptional regulator, transcriptional activator of nhaA